MGGGLEKKICFHNPVSDGNSDRSAFMGGGCSRHDRANGGRKTGRVLNRGGEHEERLEAGVFVRKKMNGEGK